MQHVGVQDLEPLSKCKGLVRCKLLGAELIIDLQDFKGFGCKLGLVFRDCPEFLLP